MCIRTRQDGAHSRGVLSPVAPTGTLAALSLDLWAFPAHASTPMPHQAQDLAWVWGLRREGSRQRALGVFTPHPCPCRSLASPQPHPADEETEAQHRGTLVAPALTTPTGHRKLSHLWGWGAEGPA